MTSISSWPLGAVSTRWLGNGVAAMLGLVFVTAGGLLLLGVVPRPEAPPPGTPLAGFMDAFGPTGYLTFIKLLEVVGGVAIAIPRTRNIGLTILGPIIVNILAFDVFIARAPRPVAPLTVGLCLAFGFLLWVEREAVRAFITRAPR